MATTIEVKLLGKINEKLINNVNPHISPKYVISVTAAQIAQFFRYTKSGKKNPYQIDPLSLIKLDEKAQRGFNDKGFALQDEGKVAEIRDGLLGIAKDASILYLGTLVWNVRPSSESSLQLIIETNPDQPAVPPTYKLKITTDTIWLTDSAHRHFGIAEAVSLWNKDKSRFAGFSDEFEFSVDLYNLDPIRESSLFRELNAKQKKISASKAQQTDTGTALGLLKGEILAYDLSNQKLFDQNIEVNSNENKRHTLMTMSVFTASVQKMFGKQLIDESKENPSLRQELAEFYCEFFYKLSQEIKVKIDYRGGVQEFSPFQNLYQSHIAPVMDKDEDNEEARDKAIEDARDKASKLNQLIQTEEKIHSNAVVKALSRIAGRIRFMKDWKKVIDTLQSSLIVANNGKYFQKTNLLLQQSSDGEAPIANKKSNDDTINIQVQDQTIKQIERLLNNSLHLAFPPEIRVSVSGNTFPVPELKVGYTVMLSKGDKTYIDTEIEFVVGGKLTLSEEQIRLKIIPTRANKQVWSDAVKTGKDRLVGNLTEVLGYDHPLYGDGFKKYTSKFEIDLPAYKDSVIETLDLVLEYEFPDIDGSSLKIEKILPAQPES